MSTQPQSFFREFPVRIEQTEIEPSGHRRLAGRLVPYGAVADVLDELPDGNLDIYQEGFRRGAFSPQAGSKEPGVIRKIGLVHRHGASGLGYLGPFVALREESDGLYGIARIMPTLEENVQALLDEGVDSLSVEFRLARADHTEVIDGVRWRTRAHLDQVALEPKGAYSRAQVLAYRAELDSEQRAQAEAAAQAEAERQAAEAAEAEERERAEREAKDAEEAERRRAEWNELTERLPSEVEKQQQLVREYGVTQPGGYARSD